MSRIGAGEPSTETKIVLVKRQTRLQELVIRYNTIQQAEFYVERLGADFGDYVREDRVYQAALAEAAEVLGRIGRVQQVDREFVPNFIFGERDLVVVLGQDGLVANTLKYAADQPLIGVNPDPQRWDGALLPFTVRDLSAVVGDLLRGRRPLREVRLAQAELNDGQVLVAVNDLFIGRRTHVSARYVLRLNGAAEQQSSSGIIVSTGMGSTGWLRSVLAGAAGIASGAAGQPAAPLAPDASFGWDSPYLYFTVREPYPSRSTAANLVFGRIDEGGPLKIVSQMPESGVIFSDGVESDYLEFGSGVEATIKLAERRGRIVV
ncbi:sugar kinase [Saccharibacillus sp. CPCC 101409]|uniref:sugar kinase n=1 Tax=Saccharibacillus sp. CPCC 101409 TaxID=3058041 RepID=UPI002673232E|nr:sugar kinase [Saccharibacillus sp. CPCC 101409]MDO3411931.1 sugar kinase [Saccharibacillus sp. CPCC 101409]